LLFGPWMNIIKFNIHPRLKFNMFMQYNFYNTQITQNNLTKV